ncbi:MAG TPA: ribonuclease [Lachnospiraceae bacterium]|nr:ribonuclease [Lachnospiraceae bacterium]
MAVLLLAGCRQGGNGTGTGTQQESAPTLVSVTETEQETEAGNLPSEEESPEADGGQQQTAEAPEADSGQQQIDENGSYTTKEDVALYIHTYGKLPSNFITKKEAEKLGWTGGSLEPYAPGKCIGGNHFGNYEGLLPDGNYKECDIDTLGKKKRGAKRLIYSDDGRIYYTEDHYESFTQLY